MIVDAALFPTSEAKRLRSKAVEHLRPGPDKAHPFLYQDGHVIDGMRYILAVPKVVRRDGSICVRLSRDAYCWYKFGDVFLGELKDGNQRRA